jgi:hypothetical protein
MLHEVGILADHWNLQEICRVHARDRGGHVSGAQRLTQNANQEMGQTPGRNGWARYQRSVTVDARPRHAPHVRGWLYVIINLWSSWPAIPSVSYKEYIIRSWVSHLRMCDVVPCYEISGMSLVEG